MSKKFHREFPPVKKLRDTNDGWQCTKKVYIIKPKIYINGTQNKNQGMLISTVISKQWHNDQGDGDLSPNFESLYDGPLNFHLLTHNDSLNFYTVVVSLEAGLLPLSNI